MRFWNCILVWSMYCSGWLGEFTIHCRAVLFPVLECTSLGSRFTVKKEGFGRICDGRWDTGVKSGVIDGWSGEEDCLPGQLPEHHALRHFLLYATSLTVCSGYKGYMTWYVFDRWSLHYEWGVMISNINMDYTAGQVTSPLHRLGRFDLASFLTPLWFFW